jgi:anti-sigma regulatory factor (Ser/Thr protein kinase)
MDGLTDTAELLASELVTNAHQHSGGPFSLRLRAIEPHRLRLGVWDTNPEIPPLFKRPLSGLPPGDAERGRGLHLVERYADSWGAYPLKCGGKILWVECRAAEKGNFQ